MESQSSSPGGREPHWPGLHRHKPAGFTLVELLVSVAILSLLLLVLSSVTESASRAWRNGLSRTDSFQSGRTALELMSRELAPAVVDTRMQFIVAPNNILAVPMSKNPVKNTELATQLAQLSPVLLWMAPLGEEGSLRCLGYYLTRDPARKFYRLKRIYIEPPATPAEASTGYFPRITNLDSDDGALDSNLHGTTFSTKADWFTRKWEATTFDEDYVDENDVSKAVVSTAADGVIAFWAQCYDLLGNPVPSLSKAQFQGTTSTLYYNSAAYFQQATTAAFEGGSFIYINSVGQKAMRANRVPASVELTIVTLDETSIQRAKEIPEQTSPMPKGYVDVESALLNYQAALKDAQIYNARVFKTRVHLINGN